MKWLLGILLLAMPATAFGQWAEIIDSDYHSDATCSLQIRVPSGQSIGSRQLTVSFLASLKADAVAYDPQGKADMLYLHAPTYSLASRYCSSRHTADKYIKVRYVRKPRKPVRRLPVQPVVPKPQSVSRSTPKTTPVSAMVATEVRDYPNDDPPPPTVSLARLKAQARIARLKAQTARLRARAARLRTKARMYSSASTAGCCRICTKGMACGDSCISIYKTCHKGVGCACNG